MNLERYWAKPDKTIQQHINDLLTHLETLKTMGYIDSDDLYELVKQACYYHDIGKVTERFQQRVLAKEKQYFDPDREIPHNILSVYFVNEDQVQKIKGHDKRDYARVCFAVMYHHDYCDPIKTILEREDTIKENLAEVKNEIFKLSQKFYTQLAMVKDIEDIRAVKIKGYLHKCDYSASGNYMIEYPHDFLEQGLENCMRKWQRKNPNVEWNSLQRFCMEKQNQNIIAIAQTGMGKTEGGLWWIGNHKGYFVLPLRTAINAIYDRVCEDILENENLSEKVSLLHSESLEYYVKKNVGTDEEIFQYEQRGKAFSIPLSISTMDQLFNFVFKYQGYELKLTTLSYSRIVIDEIQMISDTQRGIAWSRALLGLRCNEIHICGAMNAKDILIKILEDCEDDYEIKEYHRNIPLVVETKNFSYNDVQEGDAIVVFSKKRVLEIAQDYSNKGIKTSIIYGDLPPEVRKMQYEQFINKENKVLVTTDAIGMGVNLPIRRIVFMAIRKFDGEEVRELTSQEVKQIAGRAGRKGIYDTGYVSGVSDTHNFISRKLEMKDDIIKQAVIGPSEEILTIKSLPLNEKLVLWKTRESKINYYTKMDISEYLLILEKIKRYKLKEEDQWDLLKVPFDVANEELMDKFLEYVDEIFVGKVDEITKPQCFTGNLDDLEIYYQKINMYYSFSKIFNLKFDVNWVYNERLKVSEDINEILIKI